MAHRTLDADDVERREHGLDGIDGMVHLLRFQKLPLGFRIRIAHTDAHEKAVQLRLRQRIGALMLDWILSRQDDEGLRERIGSRIDANLRLVHRFEHRGLCLGRCAIDLVRKKDVRKDRARLELEARCRRLIDRHTENVGRKQIARELKAPKRYVERAREGLGQHRLADAGNIFDEKVPFGKERHERAPDDLRLAADDALDRASEIADTLGGSGLEGLDVVYVQTSGRWELCHRRRGC